jgi:2-keto-3-deoxy-L-rhamnonate aldolase RhmA
MWNSFSHDPQLAQAASGAGARPELAAAVRIHGAATAGRGLGDAYRERVVMGTFLIELPTPRTIRALALAGFDFVVLDLEHSPYALEALGGLVSECHACGLPALVRTWSLDGGMIGKVLDLGANGIMVPHVRHATDAAEAVRAAHYAPVGERGVAPLIGHRAAWDLDDDAGSSVLVVAQIEGAGAVASADEIASVPGVGAVFVGPYDLAQSLGDGHGVDSPGVLAACEAVAASCGEKAMLGIYVDDPARSQDWGRRGFRLQCVGFDGRMLLDGASRVLNEARGGGA